MSAYDTIKLARKTGQAVTVEMLDAAVEEQKALVASLAVEAGVASGEAMATVKLSPFPVEGDSIETRLARTVEAIRKLSKLVYFRAKVAAGGSIEKGPDLPTPDAGE